MFTVVFVSVIAFGVVPDAHESLDEVNAVRAAKGLQPFIKDAKLTDAAKACASYRADRRCKGHTRNDFAFIPAGGVATGAGCAAWPDRWGWGACLTESTKHTHAGAAWARGRDGLRYMQLFVN